MKVQEVILKAMAGKLKWWEAAEIIGVSDRTMLRWRGRYKEYGYDGLAHRQKGKPSPKRVALATVEEVLNLYQERYSDFNVRHFHEKLQGEHGIELSYTWVKQALQGAGLVKKTGRRSPHRMRCPRRAMRGMLLHIDGSKHQWFQDDRWHDLIVVMDDATSEIYYARLVDEESTHTVMDGLWDVIRKKGIFVALYSDRGSHFFVTPKAGEKVDPHRVTQVGRALKELGIRMIAAYSPQARGRSERSFGTWQGRLPQELRSRGITQVEAANEFLRSIFIDEFNKKFTVLPAEAGTAFVRTARRDLEWIFSVQHERTVNRDNTVVVDHHVFQLQKSKWRYTLIGCTVIVHELLDGRLAIRYGPHVIGYYDRQGQPVIEPALKRIDKNTGNAKKRKAA